MLDVVSAHPARTSRPTPIRVASVPSSHVYVRHLSPPDEIGDGVVRLPDPTPDGAAGQSRWWPPVMLDDGWVRAHHEAFDVFHVHFGFDSRTPEQLVTLVEALAAHRKPLVLTVHDLRNPHHPGREEHDAQLDVLVPAAQALVTLTAGAADEIELRWGRRPVVVPHPHVVDLGRMGDLQDRRREDQPFRVGLHLKSLRAGMDPSVVLPALARSVAAMGDAVLQVDGHRDVLEPGGARFDRDTTDLLRAHRDVIDLRVHDFFDDEQLWAYLVSLDVSVLPYRFGTHSGWLEACRDLGTTVVAPSCGYYAEQGVVESYVLDEHAFDESSLRDALRRARQQRQPAATVAQRERQRHEVALAHRFVYDSLVA